MKHYGDVSKINGAEVEPLHTSKKPTNPSTCIICGAQFQPRSTRGKQKYCSDKCKKIAANRMMTASRNKKRKQELAHKKASKALAEFAREARANGMTYGQYMAYLQREEN